ncbi:MULTISPECIES: hypothetical protein [unclassified Paraburkholderia]|uniref:hypothetical protein n=1 Tax=unclassified Paraburkholderia TaxID=2615204 RepID=UPI002AB09FF9|nr:MULTISPECIES: hypothetical protein [unclassified Paraburkholderia]
MEQFKLHNEALLTRDPQKLNDFMRALRDECRYNSYVPVTLRNGTRTRVKLLEGAPLPDWANAYEALFDGERLGAGPWYANGEHAYASEYDILSIESAAAARAALVSNVRTVEVAAVIVQCGGDPCGSCAQFPRHVWLDFVNNCACVLGYWEWVRSMACDQEMELSMLQAEWPVHSQHRGPDASAAGIPQGSTGLGFGGETEVAKVLETLPSGSHRVTCTGLSGEFNQHYECVENPSLRT